MLDTIECRHRKRNGSYITSFHRINDKPDNDLRGWIRGIIIVIRESQGMKRLVVKNETTGRPSLCLWGKQRKKMRKTRVKIWEMTLLRRKSHPYHLSFLCCWHILFSEGDTVVGISVSSSGLSWSIRSNEMRLLFFCWRRQKWDTVLILNSIFLQNCIPLTCYLFKTLFLLDRKWKPLL